jgi:hypothetical protein
MAQQLEVGEERMLKLLLEQYTTDKALLLSRGVLK